MPKKPWSWRIKIDRAKCEYAFFVSHVTEDVSDVKRFVASLDKAFQHEGGLSVQPCFLDAHDWDLGNPPSGVIRQKVAASQFFLGWVTPHYLEHARRGWVWYELAYAELIELNQQATGEIEFPFVLPVFRQVSPQDLSRTPWHTYFPREIEPSAPDQTIDDFIEKLVPRVVAYYRQQMRKWSSAT